MIDTIIVGDCLEVMPGLPTGVAQMVFADPPDNIGANYDLYKDCLEDGAYRTWLMNCLKRSLLIAPVSYWSVFFRYEMWLGGWLNTLEADVRKIIWRFTFGQHNKYDLGNGYRPIFRIMQKGAELFPEAIRIPSARQTKYNDKRANPAGRVPDDVWDFPRVCGTFKERCAWHPTQHPIALVERCIKLSTKPGDVVLDPVCGTGTTCVAAQRTGRHYIGIELSEEYAQKARERIVAEVK